MIRKPTVSGTLYKNYPQELKEQIEQSFLQGPGMPDKRKKEILKGIIVPHAGYEYSGKCAAYAYKEIAEHSLPDAYIIFGTNHSGIGGTALTTQDWETPLGEVKCHKKFAEYLSENIEKNDAAHQEEHSIEVQLPFLQFIKKNIKIIPISIAYDCPYEDIAFSIAKAIENTGIKVTLIASSDFTHYGPNYGYVPFKTEIKEHIYNLDRKAISYLNKLDAKGFLKYIDETHATICGNKAIATMIATAKLLGATKAELLNYYTSGDISKDYKNAVGYASMKII